MIYTASRLSEGNKVYPVQIDCEDYNISIKQPGLFSNKVQTFDYKDISSVTIDSPFIGYSSVKFNVIGEIISVTGFSSSDVKKIKECVDNKKSILRRNRI
jgi:hypothetical protein